MFSKITRHKESRIIVYRQQYFVTHTNHVSPDMRDTSNTDPSWWSYCHSAFYISAVKHTCLSMIKWKLPGGLPEIFSRHRKSTILTCCVHLWGCVFDTNMLCVCDRWMNFELTYVCMFSRVKFCCFVSWKVLEAQKIHRAQKSGRFPFLTKPYTYDKVVCM